MKRGIILTLFIVAVASITGFSAGNSIEKETRNIKGFTRVSFGVSGNLYIKFGPEFNVELEGEKSLLDDIVTEVTGGRLVIKKENWRMSMNEKVIINITMPELSALGVSGSGKAEILDPVKAGELGLSVSGSGKILTSDVASADLNCSISGSGDIMMGGGATERADISVSGSGNYTGESFKIGSVEISISGSGNCSCNVTSSLKASVSGSGNVTYLGNPQKVDARVSGSGKVRSK